MNKLASVIAVLNLICVGPTSLEAQTGTVAGRVSDARTGAALSGVQVSLGGGIGALSTADGSFSVRDVAPGTHTVTARLIGYATLSTEIQVRSRETVVLPIALASEATTLAGVAVIGRRGSTAGPPPPYPGGQVAQGGRIGLLGNLDLMDAPFNVASFAEGTIQDQQARTVADVVSNDPSLRVTASSGGILDSYFIRGFPIGEGNFGEIALDGTFGVAPTYRVFTEYAERIEVVKGPTALLNGLAPNSAIGGTINVVPKRASTQDLTRMTADYATGAQVGGHVDVSRRFGAARRLGARFNGSYRDGGTPIDNQSRTVPVGALALDYTAERLRATVDFIAQREEFVAPQRPLFPAAGITIPAAPDGRRNIQQGWERSTINDRSVLGRVEYDVTDKLAVFAAGGGGGTRVDRLFGTPRIASSAGDARVTPQAFIFDVDREAAEFGLRSQFATARITHSVTLQANRFHARLGRGSNNGTPQSTNIYQPAARPAQDVPEPAKVPVVAENHFGGLALADRLMVADGRLQLTLGVRRQQIASRNFSPTTGVVASSSDEAVFTPLLGVVVRPWTSVSLYANHVEGLSVGDVAPATATNAGEVLPPFVSEQTEAGVKVDLGRWAATLSAFEIEKPFGQLESRAGGLHFGPGGEQRNRGLELFTFGQAAPGVRLLGGVTVLEGKLTKTTSAGTRGNTPIGVPSVQVNVGGEWDAPFVPGLAVNAKAIHTGRQYVNVANTQWIPAWSRLDLGAGYRAGFVRVPVALRATVENALDKDYWAGAASFGTLAQGTPRSLRLSITLDF